MSTIRTSPSGPLADATGGSPTTLNKGMVASTTASDEDLACLVPIAVTPSESPANGGQIDVRVNGVSYQVGNASKVADCYFSGDGGVTPRALTDVVAGDLLYWVGSIAGFELDALTDRIDYVYDVS